MSSENLRKVLGAPAGNLLINEINLGDILTLQSGEEMTIRGIANFGRTVSDVSGFLVLGELKYMLTLNDSSTSVLYKSSSPVNLHKGTRLLLEGSLRYWSNHLPGINGAMGEIQFRMLEVPGEVKPWFYLYRGPERILFKPSKVDDIDSMKIMFMPRSSAQEEVTVLRHAVVLAPLTIELPFGPSPVEKPVEQPVKEPEPVAY